MSKLFKSILLLAMLPLLFLGCNSVEETQESKIGMILVGPKNDKGWSQAHYEGGEYAASKLGGEMITVDMVNPADSPDLTIPSVVEDMVSQGATIIFATSDDMKDGILEAAEKYPDTDFVWSTGDSALVVGRDYRSELKNVSNVMGKMEYGQMIAGCAAAIKSKTGKIGFLGPLVNDETRRLANATYLGAKHCADGDIEFDITWIGFWFHIPGMTLDPTQVVNDFYDSGKDVVISHIDTTEAVVVTGQRAEKGEDIWVVPYDYKGACEQAPTRCLGVNYFNWGPEYLSLAQKSRDGEFTNEWLWVGPYWKDLQSSIVGWNHGEGLDAVEKGRVGNFIEELKLGLNLFTGPLNFNDGSVYLEDGEIASDIDIWYTPQLLEGMK
jgi:simple sugar transport system substrate-binding protein